MSSRPFSHVIGFDDAPFDRAFRGDVRVVGAVFAGLRIEAVIGTKVRRDGANATRALADVVRAARVIDHLHLVMMQGIALGGFNVVDIHALHEALGVPVLVVARKRPDLRAIQAALRSRVPGGERKWGLIEKAGPMEPVAGLWAQRAGIGLEDAARVISGLAVHGKIPEPLRVAHLIAGGVTTGRSRGRA